MIIKSVNTHDLLSGELTEWAGKDQRAREARRQADREVIEKNRALSPKASEARQIKVLGWESLAVWLRCPLERLY